MFAHPDRAGWIMAAAGHALLFGLLSLHLMRSENAFKPTNPAINIQLLDPTSMRSSSPATAEQSAPPESTDDNQSSAMSQTITQVSPIIPAVRPLEPEMPKPVNKAEARKVERPTREPSPAKPVPATAPAKSSPTKPSPTKINDAKPALAKASAAKAAAKPTRPEFKLETGDIESAARKETATAARTRGGTGTQTSKAATSGKSDTELKAGFIETMLAKMKPYWKAPTGADTELLKTMLVISLNRDGSVASIEITGQTGVTDSNTAQKMLHAERARRAVMRASPFDLPPELYAKWKILGPITFDKKLN